MTSARTKRKKRYATVMEIALALGACAGWRYFVKRGRFGTNLRKAYAALLRPENEHLVWWLNRKFNLDASYMPLPFRTYVTAIQEELEYWLLPDLVLDTRRRPLPARAR